MASAGSRPPDRRRTILPARSPSTAVIATAEVIRVVPFLSVIVGTWAWALYPPLAKDPAPTRHSVTPPLPQPAGW